jgi:predicted MFS family arabinose efflux permease
MVGAALGGAMLPVAGVAGLPLVGGVLAAVGLVLLAAEPRLAARRALAPG